MSYSHSRSSHSARNGPAPSARYPSHSSGVPQGYYGNSLAPPPTDRRSSSSSAAPTYNYSLTPPPSSDRRSYSTSHADVPASRTSEDVGTIECPDITSRIVQKDSRPMSGAGGPFSELFVGYMPIGNSHIKVAIKVIKDSSGSQGTGHSDFLRKLQRRTAREARLWYSLTSHEVGDYYSMFQHNILPLYGLASLPAFKSKVPGFVMPYCELGTVLQYIERHPAVQRLPLIQGIANGLSYIHEKNFVHGDIKSANILMSPERKPLLSDFGCAKIPNVRGYTTEFKSSERYIAPELAIASGSTGKHLDVPRHGTPSTKESDVWAFGMVGAEVLGGSMVFPNTREHLIPIKVAQGLRPKRSDFPKIRDSEADVIWPILEYCWYADQRERRSMKWVLESLSLYLST